MTAHVEPQYKRRPASSPKPRSKPLHDCDTSPNPFGMLSDHGDQLHRTASALGELASETSCFPNTWAAQRKVCEELSHEFLETSDRNFKAGVAHGKWLMEAETQRIYDQATELLRRLETQTHEMNMIHAGYNAAMRELAKHGVHKLSTVTV